MSELVTELIPNIDSVLISSELMYVKKYRTWLWKLQRLPRGPELKRRGRLPQDQSQTPIFRPQAPTQLSKSSEIRKIIAEIHLLT